MCEKEIQLLPVNLLIPWPNVYVYRAWQAWVQTSHLPEYVYVLWLYPHVAHTHVCAGKVACPYDHSIVAQASGLILAEYFEKPGRSEVSRAANRHHPEETKWHTSKPRLQPGGEYGRPRPRCLQQQLLTDIPDY